ncbi:MAG: MerR family transcriptional regulator [Lapillicoccus sp.]
MSPAPQLKIGDVARQTGLTARTLRYYEDIGLLAPTGRLPGGHRVYARADLARLYRICLLRQLGTPLADIADALQHPEDELVDTVDRHLEVMDERLAAMGRLRERVRAVSLTLHEQHDTVEPDDAAILAVLDGMSEMDPGISQRLTLLVYDDIEAAHDHLVTVFGFGPGRLTRDEDGRVVHGELHVGDGVVWMHPASPAYGLASPRTLGGSSHCMAVFVDDVDAHHERAVAAGAEITAAPRDMDYGVREYGARDLEGGLWSFMTSLDPTVDSADTTRTNNGEHDE